MKNKNMKPLTTEQAQAILSTAIESGIAYWMNEDSTNVTIIRSKEWQEAIDNGTYDSLPIEQWIYLGVQFTWEGKDYHVTLEAMQEAFPKLNEQFDYLQIDIDNYDANDADTLFQYTAFGEIIYG